MKPDLQKTSEMRPNEHDDEFVPREAWTKDGMMFNPRMDRWSFELLTSNKYIVFEDLDVSRYLINCYKNFLICLLRKQPVNSVRTASSYLRGFIKYIGEIDPGAQRIEAEHLLAFYYQQQDGSGLPGRVNHVLSGLRRWGKLGLAGVTDDLLVTALRLPKNRPLDAPIVAIRDPKVGAFSNLEFDALFRELHASFGRGEIPDHAYTICVLSAAVAARPDQISALLLMDFKSRGGEYEIDIPRAKQRNSKPRSSFTTRPLVTEIGILVMRHVEAMKADAKRAGISDKDAKLLPMFPAKNYMETVGDGRTPRSRKAEGIGNLVVSTWEGLGVVSERTGATVNVTSTRWRRTAGTRAAQEGKSVPEIAAVLDHSTLLAARHYVEMTGALLRNLDLKMALSLSTVAQRFSGKIISRTENDSDLVTPIVSEAQPGGLRLTSGVAESMRSAG